MDEHTSGGPPLMTVHLIPGREPKVHRPSEGRSCDECRPKVGFWKKGAGC